MSQHTTPIQTTILETPKSRFFNDLLKRIFDVIFSSIALLILSPLFLYIAYRIKRDSPGPVFFRGPRIGKNNLRFNIIKFRTMLEKPESYQGPPITAEDDPRITPYGRTLRNRKLNELPQLWNVLKGDMSLVGPRPEDPQVVAGWSPEVRQEILTVRPGITSPSSVRYRHEEQLLNGEQLMDTYMDDILPSKLRLDQLYVRHRSFWGDLDILFWTSLVLLPRMDTVDPSDRRLFVGPLNELMRHYVSWFLADLVIALAAIGITGLLWRSFEPLDIGWRTAIIFAVGFAVLCSLAGYLFGVQHISWSKASGSEVAALVPAVALATIITLLLNQFVLTKDPENSYRVLVAFWNNQPLVPTAMILMASIVAFIGFVIVRYRSRLVTGTAKRWLTLRGTSGAPRERVLIVGGGETGQFAAWILGEGSNGDTFRVIGYVDDDLFKHGTRIRGSNVLGGRSDIPRLAADHDVGIILFAIHNITPRERNELLSICSQTRARVLLFPDIPAALSRISRNGNDKKSAADEPSPSTPLPCHLCLAKASPLKIDTWLAQIDTSLNKGDIKSAQAQIQDMRQQVRGDAKTQLTANLKDGKE